MVAATVVETKEFSGATRKLVLLAIKADDKAIDSKKVFYAAIYAEGIMPSSIELYKEDAKAISISTLPKKVQAALATPLFRNADIVKGIKGCKGGNELTKHAWRNYANKKAERLLLGYPAYIMFHHHKQELHGVLVPTKLDENNRPVKLPKAEKAVEIKEIEFMYGMQVRYSNIKTPRTAEVEIAKYCTKICDLLKAQTAETKKRFNELTVGKKTVEVTAKTKAKK
jgi:hypothetical protein